MLPGCVATGGDALEEAGRDADNNVSILFNIRWPSLYHGDYYSGATESQVSRHIHVKFKGLVYYRQTPLHCLV